MFPLQGNPDRRSFLPVDENDPTFYLLVHPLPAGLQAPGAEPGHGPAASPAATGSPTRGCQTCGQQFTPRRRNHVICSTRCRVYAWRARVLLSGEYVYDHGKFCRAKTSG